MLLIVAVALGAAYAVAPESPIVDTVRILSPIGALAAVVYGIRLLKPARPMPWTLVAAGLAALACAYLAWAALDAGDQTTFPSVADGFHFVSWVAFLVAVVMMVRDDRHARDAFGSFEVVIVSIAVGTGVWLLVVEPRIAGSPFSTTTMMWAAVVPILGGMAFASAVRLAANNGFRDLAPLALMAGIAVQLVADVTRSAAELSDDFSSGGVLAALGVAAPLVIASAAVDPTMAPRHRRPPAHAELGVARTIGLSVAVLAPLTVLLALIVSGLGSTPTLVLVAAASVVSVVFALARMWVLLDAVHALTERRGQDRLAAMVEHSSDVVVLVEESGHIKYASPGLTGTLGHRSKEWTGRLLLDLIAEEDRGTAAAEFANLFGPDAEGTARFESNLVRVDDTVDGWRPRTRT